MARGEEENDLMKASSLLLLAIFALAFPQEAPSPKSRPAPKEEIQPRTKNADFLGTVRLASDDLFGGSFLHAAFGNPTFTMVVVNHDARQTLVGLDGFVGFAPGAAHRVIGARADRQREASPGTWEPAGGAGQVSIDERGVISITDLAVPPGGRVQVFVDFARTPDSPYAFGFKAAYR
jgi:hypothetical protein